MKSLFRVPWHRLILSVPTALIALLMSASVGLAQVTVLPQQDFLPLDLALQGASAALAQCQSDGYEVSVSVVDRSGLPKIFLRSDGAGPHTIFSSTRKAYTAVSYGRATQALADIFNADPAAEGLSQEDSQLLFVGGGVPIVVNESVIGAIGVTGAGDGASNEACAEVGVNAILAATSSVAPEEATEEGEAEATPAPTEEATEEPAEEATAEPEEEATPTPEAEEEGAATTTS